MNYVVYPDESHTNHKRLRTGKSGLPHFLMYDSKSSAGPATEVERDVIAKVAHRACGAGGDLGQSAIGCPGRARLVMFDMAVGTITCGNWIRPARGKIQAIQSTER